MICPQCSHENPEDHKFCGECGAKLAPQPVVLNDYFQDRRQVRFAESAPLIEGAAKRGNGSSPAGLRPNTVQPTPASDEAEMTKKNDSSEGLAAHPPDYTFIDK